MENLIFFIFIIVMFLLQAMGQILTKRKRQSPQEEKPSPKEKTLEDILESLGFPPVEKEEPVEVVFEEKKEEKPKFEETEEVEVKLKPKEEKEPIPVLEKISIEKEVLSLDKLEEAIIYSTIIDPPKAYQIRRGVGTGIRSGLKNRCP